MHSYTAGELEFDIAVILIVAVLVPLSIVLLKGDWQVTRLLAVLLMSTCFLWVGVVEHYRLHTWNQVTSAGLVATVWSPWATVWSPQVPSDSPLPDLVWLQDALAAQQRESPSAGSTYLRMEHTTVELVQHGQHNQSHTVVAQAPPLLRLHLALPHDDAANTLLGGIFRRFSEETCAPQTKAQVCRKYAAGSVQTIPDGVQLYQAVVNESEAELQGALTGRHYAALAVVRDPRALVAERLVADLAAGHVQANETEWHIDALTDELLAPGGEATVYEAALLQMARLEHIAFVRLEELIHGGGEESPCKAVARWFELGALFERACVAESTERSGGGQAGDSAAVDWRRHFTAANEAHFHEVHTRSTPR